MTTVLFGECVGSRGSAPVRISDLADSGCDLELESGDATPDGEIALWIGAVGPFEATATRRADRHLAVRFKQPVDGKILQHFNGV